MIPADIRDYASSLGIDELEEIELRNGETVYLIQGQGMSGLPLYLHYDQGSIVVSNRNESMTLFDEPSYMGDDNA